MKCEFRSIHAAALTGNPRWWAGLPMGGLGVLAFSGTLPSTRLAVPVFGPLILTGARIEIAAILGMFTLLATHRWHLPERRHWFGILVTGIGLAIGYPFFVALALRAVPATHGAVVIGLAPAVTAAMAVWRADERPRLSFWIACAVGWLTVIVFALHQSGGRLNLADGWLILALLSVGFAYVEGGRVSRELGGVVVLCWAMIALAPLVALPLAVSIWQHDWPASISAGVWSGFWYASAVSMFLGSAAWYSGLAAGGIARIGQLNLLQPLLALLWSALFLGETVTRFAVVCACPVAAAMVVCIRSGVPAPTTVR